MGHRPGFLVNKAAGVAPCPPHFSQTLGSCGGVKEASVALPLSIPVYNNKTPAIVRILKKADLNPKAVEAIENEMKAAQRLKGLSGVCLLTKAQESQETLALSYSPASVGKHQANQEVTLLEFIKGLGRVDEEVAKTIFGQLASALACCHDRLVCHRDLKLPSILVNPATLVVRIADFSHSTLISHAAEPMGDRRGSPAYISPEILVSRAYSGQAADCWSLGVVLYAMVCGAFPFVDATPALLFDKIMKAEPTYPAHLSPQLCSLLRALLKPVPSARLSARGALSHPWLSGACNNDVDDQMVPETD